MLHSHDKIDWLPLRWPPLPASVRENEPALIPPKRVSLHEGSKAEPGRRWKSSLSLRHSHSRGFCTRSDSMHHSPQTTQFAIFLIRITVRFQFTWYQNAILYQNKNFIQIEHRNKLILECLVQKRNIKKIYWDGMNLFQNECHSGIMWIAPNSKCGKQIPGIW